MTKSPKKISIIGTGKIGLALATLWSRAGHSVCLGSRDPQKRAPHINGVNVKSIKDAAQEGEIIVLAVPYLAVDKIAALIKNEVLHKVIIDATNPFGFSPEGHVISTLDTGITAGSRMATLLPNSTIVRAFTHIMEELLVSRGTAYPGVFAVAIAGDDMKSKQLASELTKDAGFVAVDIGTLKESAPLDPGGILFPQFFTPADMKLTLQKNQPK